MSQILQQAADLKHSEMGQKGSVLLTDTTAVAGSFRKITVIADAVFATLTSDATLNGEENPATGADYGTVPAGTILHGKFTAVTLTSGKVILYK